MTIDRYDRLLSFLGRLEEANISFRVERNRFDAVSVFVVVPGQRWEVDFLEDGDIDVERFVSNGRIENESSLDDLFSTFSDALEVGPQSIESNGAVTK